VFIFADRATSRRFEDLAEAEGRKEAQNWLEQRGLLKKLPTFNPAIENVMSYSRKLEKFCGMKAGSVLTSYGPRFLTVKSHWTKAHLSKPSSPGDEAKFMCLMNALRASDLEAHGVHFGFVGSEASPAIETR
jgi:hypothetical protein